MNLDADYKKLPLAEQHAYLKTILERLLDSSALSEEKRDCLDQFAFYDWQPLPGCDKARFNELLEKGKDEFGDGLSVCELNEFIEMVSDEGDTHIYFELQRARIALLA